MAYLEAVLKSNECLICEKKIMDFSTLIDILCELAASLESD